MAVIPAGVTAAARAPRFVPAQFVVSGKPLVSSAGRSVSVFLRPSAVVVDGCLSRSAHVRRRGNVARLSVRLTCRGVRGTLHLIATIRGSHLDGVLVHGRSGRHFRAKRVSPKGVLLHGPAKARALSVMPSTNKLVHYGPSELSRTGKVQVARTEIDLLLSRKARVADVNAALAAVGGRIMGSVRGSPLVAVSIPDPGGLRTLDKLRAVLLQMRGVAHAEHAVLAPQADALPSGFASPPTGPQLVASQHLLALRMPAAWNARGAIQMAQRPRLLVMDEFGSGPLDRHVDAVNSGSLPVTDGNSSDHGYHVVGIAAADFADDGTQPGLVTGVFPATSDLYTLDASTLTTVERFIALELEVLRQSHTNAHLVVNTSQNQLTLTNAMMLAGAESWTALIHNNGLDSRLVQATSAGNQGVNATLNSAWNASVLASPLLDLSTGQTLSPLKQTLVVENVGSLGVPAFDPGCIASTSDFGGNIAAVGKNVFSMLSGPFVGQKSGTSMATPQIAALAEYLWSIAPDLTAEQITSTITQTARPARACESAPPADAYAAVLSLDHPGATSKTGAPVRFAILDDNGDGKFDETDVIALTKAITTPSHPGARDWSREDLNGDGFTGGDNAVPFDLDTTGSTRGAAPHLSDATQSIKGSQVSFHENAASDKDILCYYAYSPLYTGSESIRDATLGDQCVGPKIAFNGPGSASNTASVWTMNADGSDQTRLTNDAFSEGSPAWSPDRQQIAYGSTASGFGDLFVMNADGSGQHPIRNGSGVSGDDPTWSPDGQEIAYLCGCGEWRAIKPDGTGDRLIFDPDPGATGGPDRIGSAEAGRFAYSPDGARLAVSISPTGRGAPVEIWTVGRDGGNPTRLTTGSVDSNPDFSPDGTRIVFNRGAEIWIMNADGSGQTLLTTGFGDARPDFSPDGKKIVFDRVVGSSFRLLIMNVDGTGVTQLPTSGNASTPAWGL